MKKVDQYIDSKKYDKESVLLFLHKKSEHFYPSLYEYWGKMESEVNYWNILGNVILGTFSYND